MWLRGAYVLLCSGLLSISGVVLAAANNSIERHTLDSGGIMRSSSGNLELSGTVGQMDAGTVLSGGPLSLTGGFWLRLSQGDCNEDGIVDLNDFSQMVGCFGGPHDSGLKDYCLCFDADEDGDVDLRDFSVFQNVFGGQ